jgi:hypothetical protein
VAPRQTSRRRLFRRVPRLLFQRASMLLSAPQPPVGPGSRHELWRAVRDPPRGGLLQELHLLYFPLLENPVGVKWARGASSKAVFVGEVTGTGFRKCYRFEK